MADHKKAMVCPTQAWQTTKGDGVRLKRQDQRGGSRQISGFLRPGRLPASQICRLRAITAGTPRRAGFRNFCPLGRSGWWSATNNGRATGPALRADALAITKSQSCFGQMASPETITGKSSGSSATALSFTKADGSRAVAPVFQNVVRLRAEPRGDRGAAHRAGVSSIRRNPGGRDRFRVYHRPVKMAVVTKKTVTFFFEGLKKAITGDYVFGFRISRTRLPNKSC